MKVHRRRSPVTRVTPGASEHARQVALFTWAMAHCGSEPDLAKLYAIPNGGARHIAVAVKLKAEGVKPGVPDTCLPVARRGYHGCYIEMKSSDGRVSPEQKERLTALAADGYAVTVARDWTDAAAFLAWYLDSLPLLRQLWL